MARPASHPDGRRLDDVAVSRTAFQGRKLLVVANSRTRAGNRLGLKDWILVGYALIAEEGVKGLKTDPLCNRLGVTPAAATARH